MSTDLDRLIKSLEDEAAEEQAHAEQVMRTQRYASKHARSGLARTLQRLETLKTLRKSERRGNRPQSHQLCD